MKLKAIEHKPFFRYETEDGSRLASGYYGIPGREGNKVHVVAKGHGSICGHKQDPRAEFQWCCWGVGYVECEKCLKTLERARANAA